MTATFFVDASGNYLGSFDGPNGGYWNGELWGPPPAGVIAVPTPPPISVKQLWENGVWSQPPIVQGSKPTTIDAPTLAALLVTKGVITQADVTGGIAGETQSAALLPASAIIT